VYRLGDRVTVRIKKTDIDRRLIDLVFVTPKIEAEVTSKPEPKKRKSRR
jgi:hypothetical protein